MKKWQSFSALKRVKNEIESLAGSLANALEQVISTPIGDVKNLDVIRESAEKFSGVPDILCLLEFEGLSILAREIHLLVRETQENEESLSTEKIDVRLELSFVALFHVPVLLENALVSSDDSFHLVFTLLNRLRNVRNAAPIFHQQVLLNRSQVNFRDQFQQDPEKFGGLLKKQSDYYSRACHTLLKDPDNAKAFQVLKKVVTNLELALRDYRAGVLWGLAAALLESFTTVQTKRIVARNNDVNEEDEAERKQADDKNDNSENDIADKAQKIQIIKIFSWLTNTLHDIENAGTEFLSKDIDDSTRASLLAQIKQSENSGPRSEMVLRWYGVNDHMNRNEEARWRQIQVKYYSKGALVKTLGTLNTDIVALLDSINHFSEQATIPIEKVIEVRDANIRLGSVMDFLGMYKQAEELSASTGKCEERDPAEIFLNTARILFNTSRELGGTLENLELDIFATGIFTHDMHVRDSAKLHTIQAAMDSLESVIYCLDSCVDKGVEALVPAINTLDSLSRVFIIMSLEEEARQLRLASDYLSRVSSVEASLIQSGEGFQSLCHLIINLLWYMEQLTLGREKDSEIYLSKSAEFAQRLTKYLPAESEEAPVLDLETSQIPTLAIPNEKNSERSKEVAIIASETKTDTKTDTEDDEDIRAIFAEEFDEILVSIKDEYAFLRKNNQQYESIGNCRRYFHTLKGSGKMVGANQVHILALAMENLYDYFCEKQLGISTEVLLLTEKVLAMLASLKDEFLDPETVTVSRQDMDRLCDEAGQLLPNNDSSYNPTEPTEEKGESEDRYETVIVDAENDSVNTRSLMPEYAILGIGLLPLLRDNEFADNDTAQIIAKELSIQETGTIETVIEIQGFCNELNKIISDINKVLSDGNGSSASENLVIPMHRIYGDTRVHGLENYSRAIQDVEKALDKQSRLPLSQEMMIALKEFISLSDKLVSHITARNSISEYPEIDKDISILQEALFNLESGNDVDLQQGDQSKIHEGFLTEARDLLTRFEKAANHYNQHPNADGAAKISELIHLFKGAAESAELEDITGMLDILADVYKKLSVTKVRPDEMTVYSIQESLTWLSTTLELLAKAQVPNKPTDLIAVLKAQLNDIPDSAANLIPVSKVDEAETETQTDTDTDTDTDAEAQEPFDQSLLVVFLEEAGELMDELDTLYLRWQDNPSDSRVIDEYLRILHTLKGSAALAQDDALSKAAHEYETFVIASRNQQLGFDEKFFIECDELLQGLHEICRLYVKDESGFITRTEDANITVAYDDRVHVFADGKPKDTHTIVEVNKQDAHGPDQAIKVSAQIKKSEESGQSNQLETFGTTESADKILIWEQVAPAEETAPAKISQTGNVKSPDTDLRTVAEEQVKVSSKLLKYLLNDADEINFSRNKIERQFHDISDLLVDMDEKLIRLKSYVRRFDETARQSYTQGKEVLRERDTNGSRISDEFDSLEMDRFTELQEMSLSLSEDYEDMQDIRRNLAGRLKDIDNVLLGQQRLTNSLQDGLISSQMLPFASIVPRLRRLVRQTSRQLKKNVRFEVESQQGNLDKNVLQGILTPFEHILRNAIDHGIESTKERRKAGKEEQAVILTRVTRQGASILVEIRDDGKGIDLEKVKKRAIEKGIIKSGSNIKPEAIIKLIFEPGFTTTDTVSKISGRGVGLDVVKNEISQIGGTVDVQSEKGRGTSFKLRLPLTSSLNRALLFEIQGSPYVVLMNSLDGLLVEKLASVFQKQGEDTGPVFDYGNKSYEYLYLGKLINEEYQLRPDSVDKSITLLLVSGKERNIALHIDSIIESRDLVVQAMGKQLASMPGIGGGVIMADGNIAIVLDLPTLVNRYFENELPEVEGILAQPARKEKNKAQKTIMVVDDSITVRKVTTKILERNGLAVITAKDGLEAIELLEYQIPDVILLDIEMPRMDGLEVAAHIRKQESPIRDIPIIMITSRIGDKHRSRAEEIGVNEYMCKPFQEENLLEHILSF